MIVIGWLAKYIFTLEKVYHKKRRDKAMGEDSSVILVSLLIVN